METTEQLNKEEQRPTTALVDVDKLKQESSAIISQLIAETDQEKTKDLTYLFNQVQTKKTIVRIDKLNELQDLMVGQALDRFTKRPDEIDNATLLQGMKTVQDMLERGQKQVTGMQEQQPLIQINQQNTEINVDTPSTLTKESRDKVNKLITAILGQTSKQPNEPAVDVETEPVLTIDPEED